jgi:serine/threonine protein kinase
MGEVYRAKDTRLDRIVAVKVLPAHLSSKPELRQRLEREARAVSSLSHPHICTLFDVGRHEVDAKLMSVAVAPGQTFDGAVPVPLFRIPGELLNLTVVSQYDVTRDGERFLMNLDTPTQSQRTITLVSGWPSLLGKTPAAH